MCTPTQNCSYIYRKRHLKQCTPMQNGLTIYIGGILRTPMQNCSYIYRKRHLKIVYPYTKWFTHILYIGGILRTPTQNFSLRTPTQNLNSSYIYGKNFAWGSHNFSYILEQFCIYIGASVCEYTKFYMTYNINAISLIPTILKQ